ncbi:MAG: sugar phosphate nucleotidyltransferase [Cyclobacteriaceae bacterium]|nr:sugar phosphate nucleotidyltransferase [Cyclobacteriaceae bacterium]
MNIVIPMAGMGKRMRPHTLTVPKPLIPIAGKPIIQRLVEDIAKVCGEKVNNIGFVIGRNFGSEVENTLKAIAKSVGAEGKMYYQDEALGTAHAVLCAGEIMKGNTVVAFADTLFKADFVLDTSKDGIIWVQKVADPSAFGVVKVNDTNEISDFIEKPKDFVSDLAIIGIYYFREGDFLKNELQYLIDNDIKDKVGEYQLTVALENMKSKGVKFIPGQVTEWLDCGNKDATVFTNQRYLEYIKDTDLVSNSAIIENSVIIPPVFIGENVKIKNSIVGPHVSLGKNSAIENSILKNAIVQTNSKILDSNLKNSMIGNFVIFEDKPNDVSIGDYNTIK